MVSIYFCGAFVYVCAHVHVCGQFYLVTSLNLLQIHQTNYKTQGLNQRRHVSQITKRIIKNGKE